MKSILLIRHAKSSWNFGVEDFDRPLNERGHRDAPDMAKRLVKKGIKVDAFVSSPAKRAIITAGYFAEAYDKKPKSIIVKPDLYEPTYLAFVQALESLDNEIDTVALFSHNPGITDFATKLTDTSIDDMPTCAIFALKANIKKWKDFVPTGNQFWFFDYPKA